MQADPHSHPNLHQIQPTGCVPTFSVLSNMSALLKFVWSILTSMLGHGKAPLPPPNPSFSLKSRKKYSKFGQSFAKLWHRGEKLVLCQYGNCILASAPSPPPCPVLSNFSGNFRTKQLANGRALTGLIWLSTYPNERLSGTLIPLPFLSPGEEAAASCRPQRLSPMAASQSLCAPGPPWGILQDMEGSLRMTQDLGLGVSFVSSQGGLTFCILDALLKH